MRRMPRLSLHFCALLLVAFGRAASAQTSGGDLDRVMAEAQKPSAIETNLRNLTDGIGGRVPGTLAMQRAIEWGEAGFKAAGADSVHAEQFQLPAAWAEGATEMSVVAPEQFSVRAISIAWAPALPPQHNVRVVDIGQGTAEDFAKAGDVA